MLEGLPRTRRLKQQKCISHTSRSWKSKIKVLAELVPPEASLWFAGGGFLTVPLHGLFSMPVPPPTPASLLSLLTRITPSYNLNYLFKGPIFFLFLKKGFYLFTFRERERVRERERKKHRSVAPGTPLTRDPAHNPGMCPDWKWNQLLSLVGWWPIH